MIAADDISYRRYGDRRSNDESSNTSGSNRWVEIPCTAANPFDARDRNASSNSLAADEDPLKYLPGSSGAWNYSNDHRYYQSNQEQLRNQSYPAAASAVGRAQGVHYHNNGESVNHGFDSRRQLSDGSGRNDSNNDINTTVPEAPSSFNRYAIQTSSIPLDPIPLSEIAGIFIDEDEQAPPPTTWSSSSAYENTSLYATRASFVQHHPSGHLLHNAPASAEASLPADVGDTTSSTSTKQGNAVMLSRAFECLDRREETTTADPAQYNKVQDSQSAAPAKDAGPINAEANPRTRLPAIISLEQLQINYQQVIGNVDSTAPSKPAAQTTNGTAAAAAMPAYEGVGTHILAAAAMARARDDPNIYGLLGFSPSPTVSTASTSDNGGQNPFTPPRSPHYARNPTNAGALQSNVANERTGKHYATVAAMVAANKRNEDAVKKRKREEDKNTEAAPGGRRPRTVKTRATRTRSSAAPTPNRNAPEKCSSSAKSADAAFAAQVPVIVKPLSAYNFFFAEERGRIVDGTDQIPRGQETNGVRKERLLFHHVNKDRRKRRIHRKTHGKISFTTLSKVIGQRWRSLPPSDKEFFRDVAKTDLQRYQTQIEKSRGLS